MPEYYWLFETQDTLADGSVLNAAAFLRPLTAGRLGHGSRSGGLLQFSSGHRGCSLRGALQGGRSRVRFHVSRLDAFAGCWRQPSNSASRLRPR